MRRIANPAPSATASTATRIVSGRRSARLRRNIYFSFPRSWRSGARSPLTRVCAASARHRVRAVGPETVARVELAARRTEAAPARVEREEKRGPGIVGVVERLLARPDRLDRGRLPREERVSRGFRGDLRDGRREEERS